jgi:hypothetical protein
MDRRLELAERLNCSPDYLWQLSVGFQASGAKRPKRPSTDLARRIEEETAEMGRLVGKDWRVSKAALRPDVWTESDT